MTSENGPVQLRIRKKYLPSRGRYGYKSSHSDSGSGSSHRRKNGAKQEHDPRVPVLLDGKRIRWMRWSEYQRMS